MCDKKVFLNSKQVKDILGLTCNKCYDEEKGKKMEEELLGKYHYYNIYKWTNVNGKMISETIKEYWKIVDVKVFYGVATIEKDGEYRHLYIEDLCL